MSGGELFTHLYKREHFKEHEVRLYIAEIVLAIEQLHKLNIIYRDIKLENILLGADGHIVIADFGLSKELTEESNGRSYSFCGTIEYMAPGMFYLRNELNSNVKLHVIKYSFFFCLQRSFVVANKAMTWRSIGGRWVCFATNCCQVHHHLLWTTIVIPKAKYQNAF